MSGKKTPPSSEGKNGSMRLPRRCAPRNDGAGRILNPPNPLFERGKLISE